MKINTNLLHNIINTVILAIPVLETFQWSAFFSPDTSLKIVGCLALAKIVINALRDGPLGLFKNQPPVQ